MPITIARALRVRTAGNLPGLDMVDPDAPRCAAVQVLKCYKGETILRLAKSLRIVFSAHSKCAMEVMRLVLNVSDTSTTGAVEVYRT